MFCCMLKYMRMHVVFIPTDSRLTQCSLYMHWPLHLAARWNPKSFLMYEECVHFIVWTISSHICAFYMTALKGPGLRFLVISCLIGERTESMSRVSETEHQIHGMHIFLEVRLYNIVGLISKAACMGLQGHLCVCFPFPACLQLAITLATLPAHCSMQQFVSLCGFKTLFCLHHPSPLHKDECTLPTLS